jgi:subtilisin family serine protease
LTSVAWAGDDRTNKALPEERRIERPSRSSLEYRLSWGIDAVKAGRLYEQGRSGSGVTVAMIDTGLAGVPADLFGSLSPHSTDLLELRIEDRTGTEHGRTGTEHGRRTAEVVAAARDDYGTVGVASGATLLSIRADIDGSCKSRCSVRAADVARGIDYALEHGARIIAIPLVGSKPLPTLEPALERARAAGAVIVAAAGNDADVAPSYPGRYASDPRFAHAILVAGATDYKGKLAKWTNKAAGAHDRYVGAPGQNVILDCGNDYCRLVSGTSYSAAYVAGALALLVERYPQLDAQQAAMLLLAGAKDVGARGVDVVSGRGVLDLARAIRLADRTHLPERSS